MEPEKDTTTAELPAPAAPSLEPHTGTVTLTLVTSRGVETHTLTVLNTLLVFQPEHALACEVLKSEYLYVNLAAVTALHVVPSPGPRLLPGPNGTAPPSEVPYAG